MNKTSTMRIDLIPEVSDVPLSRTAWWFFFR